MEIRLKETKDKVKEISSLIKERFGITYSDALKLLQRNVYNGNK